jgi:hypothetical protein
MRSFVQSLAHASLAACLLASVTPGCSGTLAVGREMEGGTEGGSVGEAGSPGPHMDAGTGFETGPGEGPPDADAGVEDVVSPVDAGAPCTIQADCASGTVCAQPANTCGAQSHCVPGTLSGPCNVIVGTCNCDGTGTSLQCPELPNGYVPPGVAYWGQCEGGTCGGIGTHCSATQVAPCPNGLQCYGSAGGFCGPSTQCGGFAGLTCPAGLTCIMPTNCADCFGSCVAPTDVSCICPADSAWATCPDGG